MIPDFVTKGTDLLDRRFVLNAFLPTFVALGLLGALVAQANGRIATPLNEWDTLSNSRKAVAAIAVAAFTGVLAGLTASMTSALIRWHTGYWGTAPGRRLTLLGRDWHRRRLAAALRDPARYERIAADYPPLSRPEEIMPTRLGNVLKNAQVYPQLRYGIDAVVVWPRLFPLLPGNFTASLGAAKADLELHLVLSALATVLGLAGGVVLATDHAPTALFLGWYWGSALLAAALRRAAIGPAREYALQIRVAFDLYRRDLLSLFDLQPDADAERACWQRLTLFWYRGIPLEADAVPAEIIVSELPPPGRWSLVPLEAQWWILMVVTGLMGLALTR